MLSRAVPRVLAFRGITTTVAKQDVVYYPHLESKIQYRQAQDHPNRNPDYSETFFNPFPQAPRYADKDAELNAIREKARTQHWSVLSSDEVNTLYDGHFRYKQHHYEVKTDKWKLFLGIFFWMHGTAMILYRLLFHHLHEAKHAEYLNDPKFLEEYIKRALQFNQGHIRGIASHWNYETNQWKDDKPWYKWGYYRYREGASNVGMTPVNGKKEYSMFDTPQ